jgi:hypothetical protein
MTKHLSIAFGVLLFGFAAALPQQAQEKGGTIRVQLNYTGTGTVDQTHKIFVALWDTAEFMEPNAHVMPVAVESTASKNGTVTFSDVKKSPAYVSSAYDATGKWDGQSGPPPAGTSLGVYSKTPGKAEPIDVAPGKTAEATISFDDSIKMK